MFEHCHIRTITHDDLPMLLRWRNHPTIRQFMFTNHEISVEEHQQWFSKANQDITRQLLVVEDAHTPVGYVQFTNVAAGAVSHWGFYTRPDAPKGSGKKLGFTALNYAFNQLRLHKVCGQAMASNEASIGFHQSLGFQQEGLLREQQPIGDTYHSLICFGLLTHEWPSVSHAKETHHANH